MTAAVVDPAVESGSDDSSAPTPTRRSRRRIGLLLGASAGVVGCGWLLLGSPWLTVTEVEVVGNANVPISEIQAAAGVSTGKSLLLVNPTDIGERVKALGSVADATVTRQWPQTVVIDVVAEQPTAYTEANGVITLMGGSGGVLGEVAQAPEDLPMLGIVTSDQIPAAFGLLASLPPAVRAAVQRVDGDERGFILLLREGRGSVVWGAGESPDAQLKATVLTAMLNVEQAARWFDVTNPRAPRAATQPLTGPPEAGNDGTDDTAEEQPVEEISPVQEPPSQQAPRPVGLRPAN